jgi:hypothetical protein
MQQHPVPQQISSYQFRLVGDMTLKQFFELAAGALISLVIYASPLHPIIKWPFVIFFVLLGIALAFLPLEERPLEKWIVAFFRSVYSPTKFYWQQTSQSPQFFQPETGPPTPEKKEKETKPKFLSKLEETEKGFLDKVSLLFVPPPSSVTPTPSQVSSQPPVAQAVQPQVAIPSPTPTSVPAQEKIQETITPHPTIAPQLTRVGQVLTEQTLSGAQRARFSPFAAPPAPPSLANTISGQVLDSQGKIVAGAILEIKDDKGHSARALKSNRAGHFLTVTPLDNGQYQLETEKEGFVFEPLGFEAKGQIIPPIAVYAKEVQPSQPT